MTHVTNYIILPKLTKAGRGYASGISVAFTYASLLSGIGAGRAINFIDGFINAANAGKTPLVQIRNPYRGHTKSVSMRV